METRCHELQELRELMVSSFLDVPGHVCSARLWDAAAPRCDGRAAGVAG